MYGVELNEEQTQSLISQINREYEEGLNYVRPKRIQYRERVIRWNKQKKGTDKININMIANAIDTLIASSYTDGLTVYFAPKDGWIGQEKADNLNYMAEFDNNEDDYQQMYYQKEQDRYFFGVSIRHRTGWDDVRKIPLFSVINPLSWIPDPIPSQTGRFDGKNYRYHGFELESTIMELAQDPTYDKEALDSLVPGFFSSEQQLNWITYAQAYNYIMPTTVQGLKHNFSLGIYHHYTCFDGKKYCVTTTSERSKILRIMEVKPVLIEEKKNPSLVGFPIILNYRKPRRNDPFGESVCDKLDDKQIAKTILFNLNIIKAKKEALGGDFIWNSRLIKNKNDILKPTTTGRNIFVDTNEPLGNVGVEIPRSQIKADTFSMMNAIDNEAKLDVSLDQMQQGLLANKEITATEAQVSQANANVIGLLNNKINSRGDKHFWFERWRGYMENLSSADKKFTVINSNFEFKSSTITKDDFFTTQSPFIIVGTKADIIGKRKEEQMFRQINLAMYLSDPQIPDVSKMIAKRMWLRANGKTPNEINVLVPLTQYERQAYDYMNMVNAGIEPESIFKQPKEAYPTFRVYLQKADNNDIRDRLLIAMQQLLVNVPLGNPAMTGAMQEMANTNQNIAASQSIQTPQSKPNRGDITAGPL